MKGIKKWVYPREKKRQILERTYLANAQTNPDKSSGPVVYKAFIMCHIVNSYGNWKTLVELKENLVEYFMAQSRHRLTLRRNFDISRILEKSWNTLFIPVFDRTSWSGFVAKTKFFKLPLEQACYMTSH